MTVIVLERASASLRGHLTKWMLEVRAGVFVGTVSARVRDELWEMVCVLNPAGGCLLVHSAHNEQKFAVRSHGDTSRSVIDIEGLTLVRKG